MRCLMLFLTVGLLAYSSAFADVPRTVNFQGRLTDSSGKFVPDGSYSLTFRIYTDSTGGSEKWQEAQTVSISKGLFNVILGSVNPIPDSIFNSPNTWLGIQVESDAEMIPRSRLSSFGYAYRAAKSDTSFYANNSDKLDGLDASAFASIGTDYGRSGVAADLYEGTTKLTDKYVNSAGLDSVYTSSGTAFLGKSSGSSASAMYGIQGYGDNSSSGDALGGYFYSSASGTGNHYGVFGIGLGSSSSPVYGSYGFSANTSSGNSYGGYFSSSPSGTGFHCGVRGDASNSSSGMSIGAYGYTSNSSTGTAYGTYGYASNSSTGEAYGGFFATSTSGVASHYGLRAEGWGSSDAAAYGCYGYGSNSSTGLAYGGYFQADSAGTGYHYGILTNSYGDSPGDPAYGIYSYAKNSSSGGVYGGWFGTSSAGTGYHYGVIGEGSGNSSNGVFGSYGDAYNYSNGTAYAGYFYAGSSGSGTHYGVYATSSGSSDSTTYGTYSSGSNSSTGDVYGGYFSTSSSGTGYHTGVDASAYSSSFPARGCIGYAQNSGVFNAYGGLFSVGDVGTGTHYGVYGYEATGGSGAAVYAAGDFVASGTKNAVLKTSKGHRLMSVIESPEVWFEDFGEGHLVNGKAHIELDPLFLETVSINNLNPMKVFVQLEGDCNGVYVVKGTTGFDVNELKSGTSGVPFSYRIVAKRKGYENDRLRETDVGKDDPNLYPELKPKLEKQRQEELAQREEQRKLTEEEHNKVEQQRLEMKEEHKQ